MVGHDLVDVASERLHGDVFPLQIQAQPFMFGAAGIAVLVYEKRQCEDRRGVVDALHVAEHSSVAHEQLHVGMSCLEKVAQYIFFIMNLAKIKH